MIYRREVAIREMKIQTAWSFHLNLVRMTIIKKKKDKIMLVMMAGGGGGG